MKSGEIKQIPNTLRKFGEAEGYCLMYDSEGKGYIFTKEQLQYAGDRFNKHPEDVLPFTPTEEQSTLGYQFALILVSVFAIILGALYVMHG